MQTSNPKTHDSLFKWLIAAFTTEFFAHYFPNISIGEYTFIDKEFISKYEALKESLKEDLFLIMEVAIGGVFHEVVIQIEHKSNRESVAERIFEYLCYAWLLKRKPVWSIAIYTDDAVWRKPIEDKFWFALSSKQVHQVCRFDVIKVKSEKSSQLIQKQSLLCRLLALKADDRGTDRVALIQEIYKLAADLGDSLTNDQKLLLEQWVQAYGNVSPDTVTQIKQEVKMSLVATTITEHYYNEGILAGKEEGKLEGEIETLEKMYHFGVLTKSQFDTFIKPLQEQLRRLQPPRQSQGN